MKKVAEYDADGGTVQLYAFSSDQILTISETAKIFDTEGVLVHDAQPEGLKILRVFTPQGADVEVEVVVNG